MARHGHSYIAVYPLFMQSVEYSRRVSDKLTGEMAAAVRRAARNRLFQGARRRSYRERVVRSGLDTRSEDMGTGRGTSDMLDGVDPTCGRSGPAVLRVVVGAQLRRLREARQGKCEGAGGGDPAPPSQNSPMGLGRSGLQKRGLA